jgi:hypothetical protein
LEHKNFRYPIFGEENGIWTYKNSAGNSIRYPGENPWQQTKDAKFALSDEMTRYQKGAADVPLPAGRGYFTQFEAFVCIYPAIHPESQVTLGDHKVRIRSYKEIAETIKSGSISSTWNLGHWRRFAEEHLKLTEVTLGEATNPEVNAAAGRIANYRTRLQGLIGTGLPSLFESPENADYGHGLINSLMEPKNFFLVGPGGSAKTFHLHHLALAVSSHEEEVPLIFEARKYRGGDFWTPFRQATAALFRGDPKQLLDDIALCGLRPVLMVDALNECKTHLSDLLRGIQTFSVQFVARVVLTSQTEVELSGDVRGLVKKLPLPTGIQKRLIYANHAGVSPTEELDYFCAGFTNTYDLTIAGLCHGAAGGMESRTDLYDRYVRRYLPDTSAVASALLRRVAAEMAQTLSLSWPRDTFERFAEEFLATQGASLTILDDVCSSRLIRLTDDSFSFEHELLFDYFKAEQLRREVKDAGALSSELQKPRNADLFDLILPRFSTAFDIATILLAAPDASVLCRALSGQCGPAAQSVLLYQCESLLDSAVQDLSTIEVLCETTRGDNGRTYLAGLQIKGDRVWTNYECLLCDVIALNLEHPEIRTKFLDLFDVTEWTLRSSVKKAAEAARFKPAQIWGEAVRFFGGLFHNGRTRIPCVSILSTLRSVQMFPRHYKNGLPIRVQLFERIGKTPESHFSMLTLLEDLAHVDIPTDIDITIRLVQQSLNSGVPILRNSALHLLHSKGHYVDQVAPEYVSVIRQMLEQFETDDIMENTLRLDALTSFGGLEPPVSLNQALLEMRALIAPNAVVNPDLIQLAESFAVSPERMLAQNAQRCLSNIFEEIFQGVYDEAYSELSDEEKHSILHLAATSETRGFSTAWIVGELLKHSRQTDLAQFQKLASRPDVDPVFPQESVAVFLLAVDGCARFDETPPPYNGGDSADHVAWKTIGEILFWIWRGAATGCDHSRHIEALWARLHGNAALAAADVLYQISWHDRENRVPDLIAAFPEQTVPILERCISERELLTSVFIRDPRLVPFTIAAVGRIGDVRSIGVLQTVVDDKELGNDAIRAIELIQENVRSARHLRST